MMFRIALIAAVLYFVPVEAYAKNIDIVNTPATNETTDESINEPEDILLRKDLAVHMGLTQQEVVFGKPRHFRSESLNNFGLDPITDEEQ